MFATAFSLAFHAWWPVLTFLWLLGSRFALVWLSPVPRENEVGRQMALWALSVAAYLAGVLLGVLLPIPELGITAQVMPSLGLEGGGPVGGETADGDRQRRLLLRRHGLVEVALGCSI
jgi:membrane associated rhomboid family serine protease